MDIHYNFKVISVPAWVNGFAHSPEVRYLKNVSVQTLKGKYSRGAPKMLQGKGQYIDWYCHVVPNI